MRQALEAFSAATEQREAVTTPRGNAEMMDIPTEERGKQDVDMGFVGSLEPARDDFIGQILLQQMGAGRSYVRKTASREVNSSLGDLFVFKDHEGGYPRQVEVHSSRLRFGPYGK